MDTIKFNKMEFTYFGDVDESDVNNIQFLINEVFQELSNTDEAISQMSSGNTMVIGRRFDDEINICVCPNYAETSFYKDDSGNWDFLTSKDYDIINQYRGLNEDELLREIAYLTIEKEKLIRRNKSLANDDMMQVMENFDKDDNQYAKEFLGIWKQNAEYNQHKEV